MVDINKLIKLSSKEQFFKTVFKCAVLSISVLEACSIAEERHK